MHVDTDLSAYLDGELTAADRARVDAHLGECGRCHARLSELRATATLLAALPALRPSRRLVPRVVERFNWLRPLRSFSTFATGMFLFAFLVTSVGRSGSGLGGGPEVPFGKATAAGAPAASALVTTAERSAATPAAQAPALAPAPAAAPPAATAAAGADVRTDAARSPAAVTSQDKATELSRRDDSRTPAPITDPLLWLGLAVAGAVLAIWAHWRLRTA